MFGSAHNGNSDSWSEVSGPAICGGGGNICSDKKEAELCLEIDQWKNVVDDLLKNAERDSPGNESHQNRDAIVSDLAQQNDNLRKVLKSTLNSERKLKEHLATVQTQMNRVINGDVLRGVAEAYVKILKRLGLSPAFPSVAQLWEDHAGESEVGKLEKILRAMLECNIEEIQIDTDDGSETNTTMEEANTTEVERGNMEGEKDQEDNIEEESPHSSNNCQRKSIMKRNVRQTGFTSSRIPQDGRDEHYAESMATTSRPPPQGETMEIGKKPSIVASRPAGTALHGMSPLSGPYLHQCFCGKKFSRRPYLYQHIRYRNCWQCKGCTKRFVFKETLLRHAKLFNHATEVSDNAYRQTPGREADEFGQTDGRKSPQNQSCSGDEDEPGPPPLSPAFLLDVQTKRHGVDPRDVRRMTCICGMVCPNRATLSKHVAKNRSPQSSSNSESAPGLKKRIRKSETCRTCWMKFTNHSEVMRHRFEAHNPRKSSQGTSNASTVTTDGEPNRGSRSVEHGVAPCDGRGMHLCLCWMTFSCRKNLLEHVRRYTASFQCDICRKLFMWSDTLQRHRDSVHKLPGNRGRSEQKKTHERNLHSDDMTQESMREVELVRCPECGACFNSELDQRRHQENAHPKSVSDGLELHSGTEDIMETGQGSSTDASEMSGENLVDEDRQSTISVHQSDPPPSLIPPAPINDHDADNEVNGHRAFRSQDDQSGRNSPHDPNQRTNELGKRDFSSNGMKVERESFTDDIYSAEVEHEQKFNVADFVASINVERPGGSNIGSHSAKVPRDFEVITLD